MDLMDTFLASLIVHFIHSLRYIHIIKYSFQNDDDCSQMIHGDNHNKAFFCVHTFDKMRKKSAHKVFFLSTYMYIFIKWWYSLTQNTIYIKEIITFKSDLPQCLRLSLFLSSRLIFNTFIYLIDDSNWNCNINHDDCWT